MNKFGRNYILTVQTQSDSLLVIQPPFTVEFDITRNTLTSANVCSIRVFNLSQNNRNQIRKDVMDYNNFKSVQLQAGYGTNLPIIFSGNITQCWSVREGTNFITAIECFDGGFAFQNAQINTLIPEGTSQEDMFKTIVGQLPNVSLGAIGNFPGSISRPAALSGNGIDILRDLTGGAFFIDNGKGHVLGNNECLEGEMLLINSESGLLGTPLLERTTLNFDMIFEPRITVCQAIELQSGTGQNFNGFYKVISIKHRGMVSQAVCGDAITSVGLWYGTGTLITVPQAS